MKQRLAASAALSLGLVIAALAAFASPAASALVTDPAGVIDLQAGYTYTDLLEYAGPVQSLLREATGWTHADYWFPQIRSLPGAARSGAPLGSMTLRSRLVVVDLALPCSP